MPVCVVYCITRLLGVAFSTRLSVVLSLTRKLSGSTLASYADALLARRAIFRGGGKLRDRPKERRRRIVLRQNVKVFWAGIS